jgi:hypothetical protein
VNATLATLLVRRDTGTLLSRDLCPGPPAAALTLSREGYRQV